MFKPCPAILCFVKLYFFFAALSISRGLNKSKLPVKGAFENEHGATPIEVGEQDFYIDLLFYHLKLRCHVVIELKACDFEPGFIGQLNMHQNAVNDLLCHPDDKPTIGLLLVKGKNETVVEYSLSGYQNPIGVAEWKNQIANALPDELKNSLPSIEDIEKELE